jgi:hypothetical protein
MNIYQPYTYLIGWSTLNKWYYGVRYAKTCHPSDLWKSYFTSSKHVKQFRKINGEPDVIQIRKIFNCSDAARQWEHKVLNRMNVKSSIIFLNQSSSKAIYDKHNKGGTALRKYNALESTKLKSKERMLLYNPMKNPEIVNRVMTSKHNKVYTNIKRGNQHPMVYNIELRKMHAKNLKGRHWYNNGITEKCLHNCPVNWNIGRLK